MSDPLPLPELDVIAPPALSKLRRFGIASTSDLLRCSTFALARSLGNLATLADVRRWQALSSVLEIDGMTLPLARALSEHGVVAARDVGQRKLSRLNELFLEAQQRGDISTVPDADAVAAMMVDSTRIRLGGLLNLTIAKPDRKPLKGARVVCGSTETLTDAHGRARLLRLPLNRPVEVRIEKSGYAPLTATLSAHGIQNIEGDRVALKKAPAKKPKPTRMLSEFDGDIVPIPPGESLRSLEVKNRPLRRGDILYFFDQLQNGEVKLASRYKELRDGRVTVPVWRLPADILPAGAALRTDYRVVRDGLQPMTVTSSQMARLRIARQVKAEVARMAGTRQAKLKKAVKLLVQRTRHLKAF
jgi:hypothetical protein